VFDEDDWRDAALDDLLSEMVPQLIAHLELEDGYVFPLEVTVMDALDQLVLCFEVPAIGGTLRNLCDHDKDVTCTMPCTVTVTDSKGRKWTSLGSATN
jgi:hypothetical protein